MGGSAVLRAIAGKSEAQSRGMESACRWLLSQTKSWWLLPILFSAGLLAWSVSFRPWVGELLQGQESLWLAVLLVGPFAAGVAALDGWRISRVRARHSGDHVTVSWLRVMGWLVLSTSCAMIPFVGAGLYAYSLTDFVPHYAVAGAIATPIFGMVSLAIILSFGLLVGILVAHWAGAVVAFGLGCMIVFAGVDSPMYLLYFYVEDGAGFGRFRDERSLFWQAVCLLLILCVLFVLLMMVQNQRLGSTVGVGIVGLWAVLVAIPQTPLYPNGWVVPTDADRACTVSQVRHGAQQYEISSCLAREHVRFAGEVDAAFVELHQAALLSGVSDLPSHLTEVPMGISPAADGQVAIFLNEWVLDSSGEHKQISALWLAEQLLTGEGCPAYASEPELRRISPLQPYEQYLLTVFDAGLRDSMFARGLDYVSSLWLFECMDSSQWLDGYSEHP